MLGPTSGSGETVTCKDCGLEYKDEKDFSGPAHSIETCHRILKQRLVELRRAGEAMRDQLENAFPGSVPLFDGRLAIGSIQDWFHTIQEIPWLHDIQKNGE